MSLVHTVNPRETLAYRLAPLVDRMQGSRAALAMGLALSALAGAPMPLPQLSLVGPVVATLAAGRLGGRAAAAIGFLAFLALRQPTPGSAVGAAMVAALVGWAVPLLVEAGEPSETASAVCIDCEGFASLDASYGVGASAHAFDLLRRALEIEAHDADLVVQEQGREFLVVFEGSSPSAARAFMARVERRFAVWLADAGYECDLDLGLTDDTRHGDLLRSARRSYAGPILD